VTTLEPHCKIEKNKKTQQKQTKDKQNPIEKNKNTET